jgi:hypothetical protein
MMRGRLALLLTVLCACVSQSGQGEPYAFVGTWSCGDQTLAFTATSYNDGTGTYPILSVAPDGRNYTLRFANGYIVALAAVTETGLTWVSARTGEQKNCRRAS